MWKLTRVLPTKRWNFTNNNLNDIFRTRFPLSSPICVQFLKDCDIRDVFMRGFEYNIFYTCMYDSIKEMVAGAEMDSPSWNVKNWNFQRLKWYEKLYDSTLSTMCDCFWIFWIWPSFNIEPFFLGILNQLGKCSIESFEILDQHEGILN